jgi:hypothetical protein
MSASQSDNEPLDGMKRFSASHDVTPDDPEVQRLPVSGICMARVLR